jgi:hypothetical protein
VRNLLGLSAVLLALQVSSPSPPIKGARIELAVKTVTGLKVTLENRRESPLVQCTIGLRARDQASGNEFFTFYFHEQSPGPRDTSPVQPQTRRVLELTRHNQVDIEAPVLQLAVFEDGFAEGAPRELDEWRQGRQDHLDDLAYWVRAFDAMPRISDPEARAFLAARLIERRPAGPTPGVPRVAAPDASPVRVRLQRIIDQYPTGPDIWIPLDRLRADVRRELAAVPAEPPRGRDGPITDVGLSWEPATPTEFVARIENLRDVAIEAFGFELVDPITARPRSARRSDACGTSREPDRPGSARIQPKEVRDLFLGSPPRDSELRLSFVLFDDQVFEGSAEAREQLRIDRLAGGQCPQR